MTICVSCRKCGKKIPFREVVSILNREENVICLGCNRILLPYVEGRKI